MANWSQATSPETEQKTVSFCDLSKIAREDLRVCIAEDNQINRKIAVSFVNKIGLKCEAYEDGKLAYDALRAKSKEGKPFHLVLMDVQMPVLDGYEATKAIRADPDPNVNRVLIIAMTASAIRGDREKCLEAGMNDYLAKPVRQTALKAMLDEYLTKTTVAAAAAGSTTNGSETGSPGDEKVNGQADKGSEKSPTTSPNGAESPSVAEKPKARRPFRRVMKKVDSSIAEVPEDMHKNSPPSGKRETDELGKISSENISPKPTLNLGIPALNGHTDVDMNGTKESSEESVALSAATDDSGIPNGHASGNTA